MLAQHLWVFYQLFSDLLQFIEQHPNRLLDLGVVCKKIHVYTRSCVILLKDILVSIAYSSTPHQENPVFLYSFYTNIARHVEYPRYILDVPTYAMFMAYTSSDEMIDKSSIYKPYIQEDILLISSLLRKYYDWTLVDKNKLDEQLSPLYTLLKHSKLFEKEEVSFDEARQRLILISKSIN